MRKVYGKIIILIIILTLQFIKTYSQKAIVIHPKVGVLIDSLENSNYLLFRNYTLDEFYGAQIFKYEDDTYNLIIYLENNKTIQKEITKYDLKKLKDRISNFKNDYEKENTSQVYAVNLNEGSIVLGRITFFKLQEIILKSEIFGEISIDTKDIVQIKKIDSKHEEISFLGQNPHYSRYFYAPSAIPLDKGEGYFQNIYLIFLSGNYAVSNHSTIGAGFSIMPGVAITEQIFFVNAKVAYPVSDKFYLGAGGLYFGMGAVGGSIGIAYGVGTYGGYNHNLTLGVGYGYTDDKLMETPVFTLCGMTRISKRISLMTENWFITVSYQEEIPPNYTDTRTVRNFECLISYGLRFFGDKLSVDLAFMNVPTTGELFFPGIPYIDFVVRF